MSATTPLILTPILKPKVWGGRRLARLGKQLPPESSPDALIGESWELADLGSTSVSGGGGEAARSIVAAGPHAGRTLHDLMNEWGDALLPRHLLTRSGDFPLLVKFLDAREHLSIQVHPSPAYAAAHPHAHLKTECWFVLDAACPDTHQSSSGPAEPPVIFKGIKPGITPADFRKLISEGRVPEAMEAVPAIVGQMHDLPSGTCHALGAGVLVAEVQTPSDTTFRVYDWAKEYNRQGRALHIEESLACIDFAPAPPVTSLTPSSPHRIATGSLVGNQFYRVSQARVPVRERFTLRDPACTVLMVVGGSGTLEPAPGSTDYPSQPLALGDTVVVPAAIAGGAAVVAGTPLNLLVVGIGARM